MDEDTKEHIFIIAAIANILALLFMAIPFLFNYGPFLNILTKYRTYLIILLLFVLIFIIAGILRIRARKYPISIKADNILYTIKDSTGKLVNCEKNQFIRANYDFIKTMGEEIIVDGKIENFKGYIEGIESIIVPAPKREGMTWNMQHVFQRQLPKNKYVKRTFSFDFIDSFTENNEFVLCRIETDVKDIQLSIIFPVGRPPHEIRGFLRRGAKEIEKQNPPIKKYYLPDNRTRIDWQIKHPKTRDIYKITWNW